MRKILRVTAFLVLLGASSTSEARWYDAKVGRWLSEDPIRHEGDTNLYRYAYNSPATYSDPSGLKAYLGARALRLAGGVNFQHSFIVFQICGEPSLTIEGTSQNTAGGFSNPHGLVWGFGNLVKNVSFGIPEYNSLVEIANKHGEGEAAEKKQQREILAVFGGYRNNYPYAIFPSSGFSGNSNSLIGSVVRKLGLGVGQPANTPGWGANVLDSEPLPFPEQNGP